LVLSEDSESNKLIDLEPKLTIQIAEIEARKSAFDFINNVVSTNLKTLLKYSNSPSELQKIQNYIIQAINDQANEDVFAEKIVKLDVVNKVLKEKVISQKNDYFKLQNSIPVFEKEYGFFYGTKILCTPVGKRDLYLGVCFSLVAFLIIWLIKIKRIKVRGSLRKIDPSVNFLNRWLGFCLLLSLSVSSCQNKGQFELDYFKPQKKLELEIIKLENRLANLNDLVASQFQIFEQNVKNSGKNGPLIYKCEEYLEKYILEINLNGVFKNSEMQLTEDLEKIETLKKDCKALAIVEMRKEYLVFCFIISALLILIIFIIWAKISLMQYSMICPRCFESGKLERAPDNKIFLRCKSEFCKESNFRFEIKYQSWPKLSFPMIGCGSAGKTLWLTNMYKLISYNRKINGLFSISVSENEEFNRRAKYIETTRSAGDPTQTYNIANTTLPIVLMLKDNQKMTPCITPWFFRSHGLSLCFDYSGELMASKNDKYEKVTTMASRCNGIVLFIDPINIDNTQIDYTDYKNNMKDFEVRKVSFDAEDQLKIINTTHTEFIKERGLVATDILDLPIAICLSKIDLLPMQGPLKGAYGKNFLKEIESCTDTKGLLSLSVINARSDIIRKYLPIIFADKNICETFDSKFGNNYMFFPVANRGLYPDKQSHDPFGVIEPLIWLQYMYGFNVLDY